MEEDGKNLEKCAMSSSVSELNVRGDVEVEAYRNFEALKPDIR